MPQKRYILQTSIYIYSDCDAEAVKLAESICKKERKKYDNNCKWIMLSEQIKGTCNYRDILNIDL